MSAVSRLASRNDSCLILQAPLSKQFGKAAAIALQQLHYWLTIDKPNIGKILEGRKWIYNTYEEWADNVGIYVSKTMFRAFKKLEEMGVVLSRKLHDFKGNCTKWYTICYDRLKELCSGIMNTQENLCIKMSRPSGQNVHPLYKDTETTSEKVLNSACATETSETLSPLIAEEALEIVKKTIDRAANEPLVVKTELFAKTITKLMRSHFGTLDNWRAYCTKIASNLFLMGKKPMKSGDTFKLSAGSLLSKKMIEDSWENKGYFNVYPLKQSKQPPQVNELPKLTLEEAIQTTDSEKGREVIAMLYHELGETKCRSWFHINGFEAIGLMDGKPYFYINGDNGNEEGFVRRQIDLKFGDVLQRVFQEVYGVGSEPQQ